MQRPGGTGQRHLKEEVELLCHILELKSPRNHQPPADTRDICAHLANSKEMKAE